MLMQIYDQLTMRSQSVLCKINSGRWKLEKVTSVRGTNWWCTNNRHWHFHNPQIITDVTYEKHHLVFWDFVDGRMQCVCTHSALPRARQVTHDIGKDLFQLTTRAHGDTPTTSHQIYTKYIKILASWGQQPASPSSWEPTLHYTA